MTTQTLISRFLLVALWVFLLWFAKNAQRESDYPVNRSDLLWEYAATDSSQTLVNLKTKRERITFILGKDENEKNAYYTVAANYFRHHPVEGTDEVITSLFSLLEVRNYLQERAPVNGLAWGEIHLVVHSNEWSGMGAAVFPEGDRATAAALFAAIENKDFPPLSDELIDEQTEIILHACALGRNHELLRAISMAFGGSGTGDRRPVVRSARYFTLYEANSDNPTQIRRYAADYWYTFYPNRRRPAKEELIRRFSNQYPEAKVDWRRALNNLKPQKTGDPYYYPFVIPVNWTVTYPKASERPSLKTKIQQRKWLQEQVELKSALIQFGIPMDDFRWEFQDTSYTFEDGSREAAILATGKSTILCVLQAITKPDERNPGQTVAFSPHWTNEKYYAVEKYIK